MAKFRVGFNELWYTEALRHGYIQVVLLKSPDCAHLQKRKRSKIKFPCIFLFNYMYDLSNQCLFYLHVPPMKAIDRTKAVTQHFLENSFKKLSIKKKIKNEKSEKHKNICFLNVCWVMML